MNDASHPNWNAIATSAFPWEQEALEWVRSRFPTHEPYRAWSNFEFIADDGSVNEVDLLVFTPMGFFLVEIKSRPGVLSGDAHSWNWQQNGRSYTCDNPVLLADLKAKRLRSLLQRQKAFDRPRVPFIEPLVFCSAEGLQSNLQGNAGFHVCLRDTDKQPGILAAIKSRQCPGLPQQPRGTFDRPMGKTISRALEQAGIRPSQRSRRVGDYELQRLLDSGPGYQDFLAKHVSLKDTFRRCRIYLVQAATSPEQRETLLRAAEREFRLLQAMEHRGVLRVMDFTNHELGPTILFQHHPDAIRLDHYLTQRRDKITDDLRLNLLRQIADTIRFAHQKHVVHRALSPRSILVVHPDSDSPQTVIMNWQLGYRQAAEGTTLTNQITATTHGDRLTEDGQKLYMAPESLLDPENFGDYHDIFSLGAICYHLFTGQPPAESPLALAEKLRTQHGLRVSAVKNGAPEYLDELVQYSTDPDVSLRLDSVDDFLHLLDKLEDALTTPDNQYKGDPTQAKAGDVLPGGYLVKRKMGTGSTATALLVDKDHRDYVLKISVDTDHNDRVRDEGEVLKKLSSPLVVRCHDIIQINDHTVLVLDPAGDKTLGKRLREEGRLSLDLLERFAEDLLEAVVLLEKEGISHRDIKPDNIGVSNVGRGDALHLVLFDFSLSRCSPENIQAGTPGYLDPFLALRKRWDLAAERYAAAVTLYQMATGSLPVWHDGKTNPTMVECEATIDAERFDPNLRDQLTFFFTQALRRDARKRFDNAQLMLKAWTDVFRTTTAHTLTLTSEGTGADADNTQLLAAATLDTAIAELGLGPAAVDALDRINIVRVCELLAAPGRRMMRMPGVGHKTRKRIMAAVKVLRVRFDAAAGAEAAAVVTDDAYTYDSQFPREQLSIDLLGQRVLHAKAKSRNATETTGMEALLGLDSRVDQTWPSQGDAAALAGVTRARISQMLGDATKRWAKDAGITALRDQVASLLEQNGGVMSAQELCQAVLAARGSIEDEPRRSRLARVVTRGAVETENALNEPRYIIRRVGTNILIALDATLADYATTLGDKADAIAEEDPLIPPVRVIEMLRDVKLPPEAEPLGDSRLVRLAAAASLGSAVSSRQEIYPRNMDPARAIKLCQGTLVLVHDRFLTVEQVRQRVLSRYPQAAPLPDHPELDNLLRDAGLELLWDADRVRGGAYVSTARNVLSVTNTSGTPDRFSTITRPTPTPHFQPNYHAPDMVEAKQFEQRLRHAEKDGAFLALTAELKLYHLASTELSTRFDVQVVDLEGLLVDGLRAAATEVGADWNTVIKADAADRLSTDWRNLNQLIAAKVMPRIEAAVLRCTKTALLLNLNWLVRYEQMPLLTRIQLAVQAGQIHGAWLLIPATQGTAMPMLDGKAVPVITTNQWGEIPESWCQNLHRSALAKTGSGSATSPAVAASVEGKL